VEFSDRSHTFWDRKRDSRSESRDSGPEFIHSRTEVTPPGTEKRDSSAETRDSGGDPMSPDSARGAVLIGKAPPSSKSALEGRHLNSLGREPQVPGQKIDLNPKG